MAQKAFWGAKESGMEAEASHKPARILAMTCLPPFAVLKEGYEI